MRVRGELGAWRTRLSAVGRPKLVHQYATKPVQMGRITSLTLDGATALCSQQYKVTEFPFLSASRPNGSEDKVNCAINPVTPSWRTTVASNTSSTNLNDLAVPRAGYLSVAQQRVTFSEHASAKHLTGVSSRRLLVDNWGWNHALRTWADAGRRFGRTKRVNIFKEPGKRTREGWQTEDGYILDETVVAINRRFYRSLCHPHGVHALSLRRPEMDSGITERPTQGSCHSELQTTIPCNFGNSA